MKLLVTGAAGFIGSTFLRLVRQRHPDWRLVVLDALTYAGHLSTIGDLDNVKFYPGKIQDPAVVQGIVKAEAVTHIVNFAAESHNDRSLLETGSFILSNTLGVHVLLEAVREFQIEKM